MALPSPIGHIPLPEDPEQLRKPHLRPVPEGRGRRRRSPLVLAMICVLSLLGILAMQLWLSLATSAGAYVTDELIVQERELIRVERAMQQRVDMLASPQHLSEEAAKLGMVQNTRPAYLRLDSKTLVGDLHQQSEAPRVNLIANAALASLTSPAPATTGPRADDQAEGGEASAETGKPEREKPSGPVAWDGPLNAPQTR